MKTKYILVICGGVTALSLFACGKNSNVSTASQNEDETRQFLTQDSFRVLTVDTAETSHEVYTRVKR